MSDIAFIHALSEVGGCKRGASLGPQALEVAGWNAGSSLFIDHPVVTFEDQNQALYRSIQYPHAKYIDSVVKANEELSKQTQRVIQQGHFPIILSGDHSNGIGPVSGFRNTFPDQSVGLVWIDAHADLHSPYTTPSGNMHGMPIGALLGIDNKEHQVNEPDRETREQWKQLKHLNAIHPKISPNDLVFIGVRDTEEPESDYIEKKGITDISVAQVRKVGVPAILDKIRSQLNHCSKIFVSFDVDSMDPSVSKGTGTPAPGGFQSEEAEQLLTGLAQQKTVAGLEITELNPTLDTQNQMANIVFPILRQFVTICESN